MEQAHLGAAPLRDVGAEESGAAHAALGIVEQRVVPRDPALLAARRDDLVLILGSHHTAAHALEECLLQGVARAFGQEEIEPAAAHDVLFLEPGQLEQEGVGEGHEPLGVEEHGDELDALDEVAQPPLRLAAHVFRELAVGDVVGQQRVGRAPVQLDRGLAGVDPDVPAGMAHELHLETRRHRVAARRAAARSATASRKSGCTRSSSARPISSSRLEPMAALAAGLA